MIVRPLALVLLAASASPLAAQDPSSPSGWVVRADDPVEDGDSIEFASMPPGWHVTTGPAAILYDPARIASGAFRIEAETYRFPGGLDSGAGILLGGSDLTGPAPDYFAFLIDGTGRFELYHRAGEELHLVSARAAHPAVVPWTEGTADNVLAAEVSPDSVRFFVNAQEVAAFKREPYMEFDGVVGLRVDGDVDLHVTRLDVTPLDAPEPE
ncbi:MAG TPA: hypothetical protein VFS53_02710 [Gemmatimonadota bacterium]|nr:hypothetical protein [Gemmatimonadota bacterium]